MRPHHLPIEQGRQSRLPPDQLSLQHVLERYVMRDMSCLSALPWQASGSHFLRFFCPVPAS